LHAAERGRKSLFEKLTAENEGRIAELMQQKPVFYENKDNSPQEILLDPEIAELMPPEFFKNPTEWIESQENIERGYDEPGKSIPKGREINELWEQPYDVSKVKEIGVAKPNGDIVVFVSKRIDPTQLEEVFLAREAYEAGIPTPKVLGEVIDHGNVYAFFEMIEGVNLDAILTREEWRTLHGLGWSDEKEFFTSVKAAIFGHDLPRQLRKRLKVLFQKYREDYKVFDLVDSLCANIHHSELLDPELNQKLNLMKLKEKLKETRPDLLQSRTELLGTFGFSSWSDVFDLLSGPLEAIIKKEEALLSSREVIREGIKRDDKAARNEITYHNFGYDLDEEIKRLKRLCVEKGIRHKDFNDRNILIDWDYENNKPKKGPDGKAKMYLIDWEPEPKSKSNE